MARAMLATKGDATTTRTIGTSVAVEAKAAVAKGKGGKAGKGNGFGSTRLDLIRVTDDGRMDACG